MAGNANSGGHNASIPAGPIGPPKPWPWERRRLRKDGQMSGRMWPAPRIRTALVKRFAEYGVNLGPEASDSLTSLAWAHHIRQRATDAIAFVDAGLVEPPPVVGKRCAFAMVSSCDADIRRALTSMGLYPLRKLVPEVPETDDDDFAQPAGSGA